MPERNYPGRMQPGVLLVHGARTSRTMWRAQQAALDRAGIASLAIDLPGHGARRGEPFTLEGALAAVHDGVATLNAVSGPGKAPRTPVVLVGISLGGYVGIEYRARYPADVAGLVAAACCSRPQTVLRTAWLQASKVIEALPDGGARLNQFAVGHFVAEAGAQDLAAGGFALEVMTAILREIGTCDPVAALAGAASPVWLVNGRWDHFRRNEREFLQAARSGGATAELTVIRGARHLVSLDAPVAVNRVLLRAVTGLRVR